MASVVGKQAARSILKPQLRGKPPTRNHQVEGLDQAWLNLEKQLARIPLDQDGSTLRDEDEFQISQKLLMTDDAPFDYCLEGFYDAGEFPKWISRRQSMQTRVISLQKLLRKWTEAFPPSDMEHWCKLPAMLRYALKRPLMPQRDLENKLKELGCGLPPTTIGLSGREQNLLLGIDIDDSRHHPSAQYHDLIVGGWLSPGQKIKYPEVRTTHDTEPGLEEVREREAQEEDEELYRQLHATYALFKKGTSDIGEAMERYRYFLEAPDISKDDLALRLEDFGIPKEHILGPKPELDRAALRKSPQQTYKLQDSSFLQSSAEANDHELDEVVKEIKNIVLAYRWGDLKLAEAVSFVSKRLEGLIIDEPCFSRLMSSTDLTPELAAQAIFESAAGSPSPSPTHQTDPDEIKSLKLMADHFLELYVERIVDGLDPGSALAEYKEEFDIDAFQPHEVSFILSQLQDSNDSVQEVSGTITTSEVDNLGDKDSGVLSLSSFMPPPKRRTSRERSPSLGSETLVRSETPGDSSIATLCDDTAVQEPNLVVAEWEHSFSGTAGNPEHHDYDMLSCSPEHGFSTDLWGLELPTATAKKLALDIGLPTDYVDRRIRSLTPVRISSTKARRMGFSTGSPAIKRKASVTAHEGRRIQPLKSTVDPTVSTKKEGTSDASVHGQPNTVLEYLELICFEIGIFKVDFPMDSKSYKAAIRTIASEKIAEIATEMKWGSLKPIQSHTERQLMSLLRDIERDPSSFSVGSLAALIQHGLGEIAELTGLGVASLRPPASSANRDSKADASSVFKGILAADPCAHKPSSRQTDLYELYFRESALLRDAGFVTQLFVCPECSKSNEPLSLIAPMKRPQRLRLTQPKNRPRAVCHDDDVPFNGTPKDMSYSAAMNCQSFFVGLETRRRQRPKANPSVTNDRYFQNPVSSPSSSGSTSHLNKLFEKYKGIQRQYD